MDADDETEEASVVYNEVCEALSADDLGFRYSLNGGDDKPESRGFAMVLERKEGTRGAYRLSIDNENISAPIRLLMAYEWPQSVQVALQAFDLTVDAVFKALKGPFQRVVAEARVRAQCSVRSGDGLSFMIGELMNVNPKWVEDLGKPLTMASAKFEVGAAATTDPLEGPKRELSMEVLREEPNSLYLELMSQWTQLSSMEALQAAKVRPIDRTAGEYITEAMGFLRGRINVLGQELGAKND